MKSLAGTWCAVGLLSAGLAVAEPKKDSSFRPIQSDQPELITPVKPVPPPPPPPQQGNNQQGQFPPGQGPNNKIPPPAAPPAEIQNQRNMPVPEKVVEHADAAEAAAEAHEVIEAIRPPQAGLDLDILNADDARRGRPSFDPAEVGTPQGDAEALALIEQIRKLTGGSSRHVWSETTKGFADTAGITTDPQALLTGAGQGRTTQDGSDNKPARDPQDGGTTKWTERHADGTTTDHYEQTDEDGHLVFARRDRRSSDGTVISSESRTRRGDQVVEHSSTRVAGPAGQEYAHTSSIWTPSGGSRPFSSWRSSDPRYSVDPDAQGGSSFESVPLHRKKDTPMEAAAKKMTSTALPPSPDSGSGAGAAPRLNVDVDLVGQPNPDQAAGGSAVGRTIRNPNDDTVDPPRPIK